MKDYKFKWIQTTEQDGKPITKCCVSFYAGEMQNVQKNSLDKTNEDRYVRTKLLKTQEFQFPGHVSEIVLRVMMDKELINVDK